MSYKVIINMKDGSKRMVKIEAENSFEAEQKALLLPNVVSATCLV